MKHTPMTQERLDAIWERVGGITDGPWSYWSGRDYRENCVKSDSREDAPTVAEVIPEADDAVFIANAREDIPALLAEVQRLRHFESIMSWRYGDTTDGRTREDMMERAKRAFGAATAQVSSIPLGMSEDMFIDSVGLQHQHAIRAALDAALGTGDGA